MKYSLGIIITIIIILAIGFLYSTYASPKAVEVKIVDKPVETKVPETKAPEAPTTTEVVESFVDSKFTSDVRDVNNTNYETYVFGGKISK
jgi:hypothetical protein